MPFINLTVPHGTAAHGHTLPSTINSSKHQEKEKEKERESEQKKKVAR
jgi:hypothetical protein